MNPEFPDEKPVNPFDFWEGANFKLKIRNVEGYRNYDKSEFDSPEALFGGDDDKLEELWKKEYSLKDFTEAKHFKPYDQLKGRLDKILGFEGGAIKTKGAATEENFSSFASKATDEVLSKPSAVAEDDDLDFFKSLAEDN
jgi:hypothetical protein